MSGQASTPAEYAARAQRALAAALTAGLSGAMLEAFQVQADDAMARAGVTTTEVTA